MRTFTSTELAQLLDAEHHGAEVEVGPHVVIDSRLASAGSLFIALPGERVDGHDFAATAAEGGAVAMIGTRTVEASLTQLVVTDAIAALSDLARQVVAGSSATTLALTGSSGKTSTKDLLAQVLEAHGPTVAPVGSFNNEIGVPLTACQVGPETRYLVSEMGARGKGHIEWLCSITRPQVAAVLNIGTAHLGEFGSVDGIAVAKREIVEALDADGWAVLNADDPRVAEMADHTPARVCWFSAGEPIVELGGRSVAASEVSLDDLQRPSFTLTFTDGGQASSHRVALPLLGRHMVANAAAAAAMAWCAGVPPQTCCEVLGAAEHRSKWRMELLERSDGAAVLNDAYNANPDSMAAALTAFGAIATVRKQRHPGARALAVLGDMLELGGDSAALHHRVGEQAVAAGIDEVWVLGDEADHVVAGVRAAGGTAHRASVAEVSSLHLDPHDVVLVKASRGLALDVVASALLAEAEGTTGGER